MKTIIGIDWSEKKHCVHAYNESGAKLLRLEVAATVTGFRKLTRQVNKLNPEPANCLVAIETAHNLLVDYLHDLGYTLCILAPSLVSSNRGRQGSSGAKDDDRDALLLAEILRTDLGRLIPWQPDGPLVRQMRILLTAVDQLTKSIVRQRNRLRALLLRFYPQALDAFGSLKTQFSLRFLTAFPGPASFPTTPGCLYLPFFAWRRCFAGSQAAGYVWRPSATLSHARLAARHRRHRACYRRQRQESLRQIPQSL